MKTAKWCNENINSGKFKFKSVLGEVKELIQARGWSEVKEEFGDVLYFTYCWLYYRFNINLPMIGAMHSVRKFTARLIVWEEIFHMHQLKFHPKYLVNGSNYERVEKVIFAIDLARREQGNGHVS
jgi:NTP pyrophosphatase (non-canonical NTP hydrolase)